MTWFTAEVLIGSISLPVVPRAPDDRHAIAGLTTLLNRYPHRYFRFVG
jgi:hypothetical protein